MDFIAPFHVIFAIQLYWLSLFIIGFVFIQLLMRRLNGGFHDSWSGLPFFAKTLLSGAVGFVVIGVITVIGYLFMLPSWWLGVSYGVVLIFSISWFIKRGRGEIPYLVKRTQSLGSLKLLSPISIFMILLLFDYTLSLMVGGYLAGDGFVHLSKIRHLSETGFTYTDAFYGTVPETRHHVSVMHTVYAIPSWFGIDPMNSWFYSLAPLRLLKWLVIFFITWRLLEGVDIRSIGRQNAAACAAIIGVGIGGSYYLNYPGFFVVVWVALLFIGLLDILSRKNAWIMISASILIALTHSLIALAACLFLMLLFVSLLLFSRDSLSKPVATVFIVCALVLMTTPVVSYLLPSQMTESVVNYGLEKYDFFHVGSFTSFAPDITQFTGIVGNLFFAWLSLIGMMLLLYLVRKKSHRLVVACAILFVPLTLYNPLFSTIIKEMLPIWAQARFVAVNALTLVSLFFGLMGLLLLVGRKYNLKKNTLLPALLVGSIIIMFATQTFNVDGTAKATADPRDWLLAQQVDSYEKMVNIQNLVVEVEDGAIVMAERYYDNFILPAVAPVHVVAISEGNSTPAADMERRSRCYEEIYESLDAHLLRQVGVKYVLAQRESPLHDLAVTKPYLRLINGNESSELFRFLEPSGEIESSETCSFRE